MSTSIKFASALTAIALASGLFLSTPQAVPADIPIVPILNSDKLSQITIDNFEQVNGTLLRGAAPSDRDLALLHESGVKTIVDLRSSGPAQKHEEAVAKHLGMNYVSVPFGFSTPDQHDMTKVLSILSDSKKQPVFLHCRQGADRTGMAVGMYRRIHDKWDFDKTYDEMRRHHFKPVFLAMKGAVKSCPTKPSLVSALSPVQSQHTIKATEQPREASSN